MLVLSELFKERYAQLVRTINTRKTVTMLDATLTLQILSVNQTHDSQGVKIAYGDCTFHSYSKDSAVPSTIPFRAKGSAAVALAEFGTGTHGIAIGFPDMEVVDSGNGYKEKRVTLVIRNFFPTTILSQVQPQEQSQRQQPQPVAERTLVTVDAFSNGAATSIDDIPF